MATVRLVDRKNEKQQVRSSRLSAGGNAYKMRTEKVTVCVANGAYSSNEGCLLEQSNLRVVLMALSL